MKHKTILRIGIAFLLIFIPINSILAQSSSAQLTDLVAQLQNSPDDQEMRKKIITLVSTMPTKPEKPDDLAELIGKAKFIMKDAKSADDYKQAVDALKQASLLAPWLGDIYYNLGVVQEKAEEPADAINSFNLYLFAKPHAKDRESVKERIGALKFQSEKIEKNSSSPEGKWGDMTITRDANDQYEITEPSSVSTTGTNHSYSFEAIEFIGGSLTFREKEIATLSDNTAVDDIDYSLTLSPNGGQLIGTTTSQFDPVEGQFHGGNPRTSPVTLNRVQ